MRSEELGDSNGGYFVSVDLILLELLNLKFSTTDEFKTLYINYLVKLSIESVANIMLFLS